MIQEETIGSWTESLASKAPTPGGGGASALGGVLAAALGRMAANLTAGKKKYADAEAVMRQCLCRLEGLQAEMLALAQRDADVFAPLAAAYGMPKETEEQRQEKDRVMERRLLEASLVPLTVMEKAAEILDVLRILEEKGSRLAVSDVGVAAQFARAALNGAAMNVAINTKMMKDRPKAEELDARAAKLAQEGISRADAVYGRVCQDLRQS